jgi:hypothetical protein
MIKLGAENKKSVYALTVLGVVAAYMVYSQFFSGPSYKTITPQTMPAARIDASSDATAVPAPPEKSSGPNISQAKAKVGRGTSSKSKNGEFRPVFLAKKKEDRVDVSTVDPTIRFDLLARAMKVPQAGGERDLFQILKTPPPKATALADANEPKVHPFIPYGPRTPGPPPGPPAKVEPPPRPITFKFYGVSSVHPDGTRTAYFIMPSADGDTIFMANEGDVLKDGFRILQIGIDRVVVEDIRDKDKRRQPLNMEKENTG